jgi:hypothetical protein
MNGCRFGGSFQAYLRVLALHVCFGPLFRNEGLPEVSMLMSKQTFAATTFGSKKAPDDAGALNLLEISSGQSLVPRSRQSGSSRVR